MQPPAIPKNEPTRLLALQECQLLDTPDEERFDRLTRLTKDVFGTSIVLISLVDAERQWFKSSQGLEACETGRDVSFCGHAILNEEIFQVSDARRDPRFIDNPLVTGQPKIRFYAGAPLNTSDGYRIGTLCIIDENPRQLNQQELASLRDLADCVEREINLNRVQRHTEALSILAQITSQATVDVKGALRQALNLACDYLNMPFGIISRIIGNDYEVQFQISPPDTLYDQQHFPLGQTYCSLTLKGDDVLAIGQMGESEYAAHPCYETFALESYIGVPVTVLGAPFGTLNFSSPEPRKRHIFSQFDIEFVRLLGRWVSTTLQRRLLDESLQESEARLRGLFELSPVGIALNDFTSGAFIEVNEALIRPTGYSREEFLSLSYRDLTPREYEKQEARKLQSLEQTGRYGPYEKEYINKEGKRYPVVVNGMIVHDNSGRKMLWSIIEDVTERKRAQRELTRFKNTLDQTLDCVFMFDADTLLFSYVNEGAIQQVGYTQDELAMLHPYDIKPEFSEVQFKQMIAPMLAGKQNAVNFETIHQHKSGKHIPVEIFLQYVEQQNESGRFVAIVRDITERLRTRNALKEQAERTQAILENMVDGIITINENGIIDSFNPAAEHIFGYSADEVLGQNINMLIPNRLRNAHESFLTGYLETGEESIAGNGREVEGVRKDGRLFPVELAVSTVTHQGRPLYIGLVRDITERKRLEEMKSEFVSTVSHELRTPLTSIRGALNLVIGKAGHLLEGKPKQMLMMAERNSERLTLLINDILDLEKIESGRMEFEFQSVDLVQLVRQALEDNEGYARQHQVKLVMETTLTEATVYADEHRLLQVLANLISNAVKFSPREKPVEISISSTDSNYRVVVRDFGNGIPEKFKKRIFQRFAQADSSDTREKGGTGLGLSISKAIIDRHSGVIAYESKPGQGARFYFELPAKPVTAGLHRNTSKGAAVLICEDNQDVAEILAEILLGEGVNSDIAPSIAQARSLLATHRYQLILLDLILPDGDGIALLEGLRTDPATAQLPVIVVSADAEEGKKSFKGNVMSVIDWLQKPVDQERLKRAMDEALNRSPRPHILHVEDDMDIVQIVHTLIDDTADFSYATSLKEAQQKLALDEYDLVILDLGLKDGDGTELLDDIKRSCPVLIFSAERPVREVTQRVNTALTKTHTNNQELLITIKTLLKRQEA